LCSDSYPNNPVFVHVIARHWGDLTTSPFYLRQFLQRFPVMFRFKCLLCITSPKHLSEFDVNDCVIHFGPTDDTQKLVESFQFVYRPACRSFFNMYADLTDGGLFVAHPNIIIAQYRYHLPQFMPYMSFIEQFFFACLDKQRINLLNRHKLNNVIHVTQYFSVNQQDFYGFYSMF